MRSGRHVTLSASHCRCCRLAAGSVNWEARGSSARVRDVHTAGASALTTIVTWQLGTGKEAANSRKNWVILL
jgi:hypothetical protein